ncbi:hypothetical protein V3C99_002241 [Haemonchus contortus]
MRFKLLVCLLFVIVNRVVSSTDTPFGEEVSSISSMIKGKHNDVLRTLDVNNRTIDLLLQAQPQIMYDQVNPVGDSITQINENSNVGDQLFQSDILLTEEQTKIVIDDIDDQVEGTDRKKRQALADPYGYKLWKEGVNFYFTSYLSARAQRAFMTGADMWQKYSCLNFTYNPDAKNRVKVEPGKGCWSRLGKIGGEQTISLGVGCDVPGIAAHEIGHTIGFWHTMARYDRDNFITLNLGNIQPSWLSQFARQTPQTNNNFNLTYDYGSIMQYGGRSAGIHRQTPTMVPYNIDYQETLGSHFMSFIDLLMVNELYGCKKICETTKSAQCEMGGFPNPRDCSKCVCPGGYAGDTCTERPDEGCGSTITATPEWKELTDVLGNYGVYQPLEDYTKCHYWIESPEGTDIVVEIVSLAGHQAVDGCIFTGVEIKTNEDQKLTGFRFCAPQDAGKTLVSSSNRVPIITWNKIARSTTILRFRHVPAAKPRPSSPTNRKASKKTATTTISTTHTRQTTGTPSSTAPTPTTAPPKCPLTPDHPSCPYHIKEGFCTDKESYTDAQRMQLCPRGCKLCVP